MNLLDHAISDRGGFHMPASRAWMRRVKLLRVMNQSDDSETDPSYEDVTYLLDAWSRGEPEALERLMGAVQAELHTIALRMFRKEGVGHTLQPTAVVNEVYLKLASQRKLQWKNRAEFFGVAANFMRRILVDHARKSKSLKRGGTALRLTLDDAIDLPGDLTPEILALDDALFDLERLSPRQSRIVEMRVIVGLQLEEIAHVMRISRATVSREWRAARLFLLSQLRS